MKNRAEGKTMGIVVTGVGLVTALGIGVEKNFTSLCEGRTGISQFPDILSTANRLPVGELKMTNEELHEAVGVPIGEHLSRTALLGILAVREAMRDAGLVLPKELVEGQSEDAESCSKMQSDSKRIALVSSTSVGGMDLTEHFFEKFVENDSAGRLRDVRMHDCAASTEAISRHCGINGYTTTISTACSSAANAVITGAGLLEQGLADYVIVGGADALSAFTVNGFKSLMILDQQPCRPFDSTRAGLNLGEGAGYLVLQREEDAKKSYCRLAGYANRNDAYHQTASSSEGNGAYLAMVDALEMAGLKPADVSYVNAHGTGTGNNDASESAAFVRLFGSTVPAFSSTKAFTGHTLAAAGGIEAVFSVLAIDRGVLYPNLNFTSPIEEYGLVPECEFRSGVDVKCVLSNSFGFGGNCSSIVFCKQTSNAFVGESLKDMTCYIENVVTNHNILTDIKLLIPDAGMRRRMSKVLKMAVSTGVECLGSVDAISDLDAIVTATGFGCLEDSERFLRNIIANKEEMLNPTPFIQSTFNTVGGQIALLRHNHCYNVTYVNRSHSFEDALLDVMMKFSSGQSSNALLGAFDEQTNSQRRIMERMGLFRDVECGEGAVFAKLSSECSEQSLAKVTLLDFPSETLSREECQAKYATSEKTEILFNNCKEYGVFPTVSALSFATAVDMIASGSKEVVVYNEYLGGTPTVLRIECVG